MKKLKSNLISKLQNNIRIDFTSTGYADLEIINIFVFLNQRHQNVLLARKKIIY